MRTVCDIGGALMQPIMPVLVCDKITMEIVKRCGCAREAAEFAGLSRSPVYKCAMERHVCRGKYVFRREEDYDKGETFVGKSNRPVAVSIDGGETYHCMYSVNDAARIMHMHRTTIEKLIKGTSKIDGLIVRYAR